MAVADSRCSLRCFALPSRTTSWRQMFDAQHRWVQRAVAAVPPTVRLRPTPRLQRFDDGCTPRRQQGEQRAIRDCVMCRRDGTFFDAWALVSARRPMPLSTATTRGQMIDPAPPSLLARRGGVPRDLAGEPNSAKPCYTLPNCAATTGYAGSAPNTCASPSGATGRPRPRLDRGQHGGSVVGREGRPGRRTRSQPAVSAVEKGVVL